MRIQVLKVVWLLMAVCILPFPNLAVAQEEPVTIESIGSSGSGELSHALTISGFGVGVYQYLPNTGDNTFGSSALAVSLFKSMTDHLSVFAQLTVSLDPGPIFKVDQGSSQETSTEIDNLQLRWAPSPKGPDITFGKFDSPMGIERDDAPLNYQATESFNFEFGRPVKFTGVQLHQVFSEHFEAWLLLTNGWDLDTDNNKGKTFAFSGMWIPAQKIHVGIGEIMGPEIADTSGHTRKTTVATFQIQPTGQFVIGAEGNYGSEPQSPGSKTGTWYGGLVFGHYRFTPHWALTARFETFHDPEGTRTGTPQTLNSFTLSPQFIFRTGFYGIFRYLERTTLSLPELVLRVDLRLDRSTQPVFISDSELGKKTNSSITVQTVFLF